MSDNSLSESERNVIERCGTESPFSSDLLDIDSEGMFRCKRCGQELFSSETKFKSGTGWPSFWEPVDDEKVEYRQEPDGRTEVICSDCGAHLGHVFNDGPNDKTGKRYCINGIAMEFERDD